jgi:iron complex outermembrane recepter protein
MLKIQTVIITILALICAMSSQAQMVRFMPEGGTFDKEITITVNLNLSDDWRVKELMGKTDGIFLWAGAGTSEENAFEFQPKDQYDFNSPNPTGAMRNLGGNKWEMKINPMVYFNVPVGKNIKIIGLLVKNANGTAQSENTVLRSGVAMQNIKEVVVKSNRQFVERQIDKIVLNIDADINATGSTLLEILQKAPGVTVSGEDALSMSGKSGVNVMIDGKPSNMTERELSSFLKSTSGNSVDRVEIISNPSAKYEAQGNAGIINIRLKKGKNLGTNGNINLGYGQQTHHRLNAGLNLNSRGEQTNIFGSYNLNEGVQHTDGALNRFLGTGTATKNFENTTIDQDIWTNHSLRIGMDYFMSKNTTLGVLVNGNFGNTQLLTPGTTAIKNFENKIDSSLTSLNNNQYKNNRINYNLNFHTEDTLGNDFNIDADYTRFSNVTNGDNQVKQFNGAGVQYNFRDDNQNLNTGISIFAVKSDYTKLLKPIKAKLELGFKTAFVKTTNDLMAQKLDGTSFIVDKGRSNLFEYKENVNAVYGNFGQKLGKLEYQLGVRVEQSNVSGISSDLNGLKINNPDTNYLNAFPSAFLKYSISDLHRLGLQFGRRINRPNYQDLNPFEFFFDLYSSEKGNPYLKPEYTTNLEINYTYKDAASLAVGYSQTTDVIKTTTSIINEKTLASNTNIGKVDNIYCNFNLPMPITKFWFSYTYLSVFYNRYAADLTDGRLDAGQSGMSLYMNHAFTLPKNWKIQLDGWYNAPTREVAFVTKGLGSVNLGFQKTILDDKATIRIGIQDIFNTQRWEQSIDFGAQHGNYSRKWESRGIRIGFSYKFGNSNVKSARERNSNQDADRIKVKTN